jgi:L-fucose isomerase-like protein
LCCSFSLKIPLEMLRPGLELHMALKRLAEDKGFDAFAVECWTGLPKALGLNPCLGFIEDSYVIACEGDAVMGVMLLAIRYMTGVIPFACDVQYVDENNVMTACHCGASPLLTSGDVMLDLSPVALRQGFNTVTCRPELAEGLVTMVRLYGSRCEHMHIACGEIISCDRQESLTVSIMLHGDRTGFIEECTGNHYIVVSGDIREELHLFGNWMKINIKET